MKIQTFLNNYLSQSPTKIHWSQIGIYHHHGIVVPMFSLLSNNSAGIGEFYDLLPLIKWLPEVGMDVIQLLPLNDAGNDPSPYNAISAKALNPIHISLYALPYINDYADLLKRIDLLKSLSNSQRIQYSKVKNQKIDFLRDYFKKVINRFESNDKFNNFQIQNTWVGIYALYKLLREKSDKTWMSWPDELKSPSSFSNLMKKYRSEIQFYIFLQFLCFEQMTYVKEYASKHSVFLKGDIPILLSSDSADVWSHREFFDCSLRAGAPPDAYSASGQDWGFPTYNWDKLEKDNYSWWKERLHVASHIYHIYRIDHVVGFFRIWVIPPQKKAIDGFFKPKNYYKWPHLGKKLLKMLIRSSTMLPIAEDLGTIPKYVPQILKEMGIPGTKIIRWERKWEEDTSFINVKDYQPISLTSVATHDSETIAEWWEKYPTDATLYAKQIKVDYKTPLNNKSRFKILYDSHQSSSIFHINPLQEYLAFFQELIWKDPKDERINIPGTSSPFNWTYRFRPKVEEIISHKKLKSTIKKLTKK